MESSVSESKYFQSQNSLLIQAKRTTEPFHFQIAVLLFRCQAVHVLTCSLVSESYLLVILIILIYDHMKEWLLVGWTSSCYFDSKRFLIMVQCLWHDVLHHNKDLGTVFPLTDFLASKWKILWNPINTTTFGLLKQDGHINRVVVLAGWPWGGVPLYMV